MNHNFSSASDAPHQFDRARCCTVVLRDPEDAVHGDISGRYDRECWSLAKIHRSSPNREVTDVNIAGYEYADARARQVRPRSEMTSPS